MSRISQYHSEALAELLETWRIATMADLKQALGTTADITVFRKLRELDYLTSYSHRGRYYALRQTAEFDHLGLWSYDSVRFSKHGTLVRTARALVGASDAGYFATELEGVLHVDVKDALRKLVKDEELGRNRMLGRYLYCSADPAIRKQQVLVRRVEAAGPSLVAGPVVGGDVPDELKAAIVLLFSLLDEKQRRLYAGLESYKRGHGGDRRIADLFGMDVGTVAKGRRELLGQEKVVVVGRVRKAGGGRKLLEKKTPM